MKSRSAFTIVELLIVIVVIAVLAAISVVAYNGIQSRAKASEASYALAQAKKKLELYRVDNDGKYPTTGDLASAGISDGKVSYQYTSDGTTYCITGTAGDVSYKASNSTNPSQGGCAGHGQGGIAAITNLVVNPSFETNTSGWANASVTTARSATGAASGSYSLKVTPSGSGADSYARYGSTSSLPSGITPGQTYTVSGMIYVPAAQIGTIDNNGRARGITVYSWNGSSPNSLGKTASAPNSTGSQRQSVTFTIPAAATALEIRFYNGATNSAANEVYWDAIMLTQGSTLYNYADGNSTNWAWSNAQNNSASTGPPL